MALLRQCLMKVRQRHESDNPTNGSEFVDDSPWEPALQTDADGLNSEQPSNTAIQASALHRNDDSCRTDFKKLDASL